ncbi:hypothetical protein KPaMU14_09265 [Kocuria palustris]|nr:hypothetical protein KPaMU14_09265 [Kocuria palustris]
MRPPPPAHPGRPSPGGGAHDGGRPGRRLRSPPPPARGPGCRSPPRRRGGRPAAQRTWRAPSISPAADQRLGPAYPASSAEPSVSRVTPSTVCVALCRAGAPRPPTPHGRTSSP